MSDRDSHRDDKPSFIKFVLVVAFFPLVLLVMWCRAVFDPKRDDWSR